MYSLNEPGGPEQPYSFGQIEVKSTLGPNFFREKDPNKAEPPQFSKRGIKYIPAQRDFEP